LDLAVNQSRLDEMRRQALQLYETEFHPDRVYGAMVKHIEHIVCSFNGGGLRP
jgi:hypothetical protein